MALTTAQKQTLAAHIRANLDPIVVAALAARNDVAITAYYNAPGATLAWRVAAPRELLFEETPIAQFDTLSAGKRDAWSLVLGMANVNATRNKVRKGIVDIWGNTATTTAILTDACTEFARLIETVLGGATVTEVVLSPGTDVTALRRNFVGQALLADVSDALNENP